MGRFEKLNRDINKIADKMMENQEICKLIHYPSKYPLDQPNVNGYRDILDKRLLLCTPKIPLTGVEEDTKDNGTYIIIRPTGMSSSQGGQYVKSRLYFDIFCEKSTRVVYYKDEDGVKVKGDRALLLMDKIDEFMINSNLGIGRDNLGTVNDIANRNATFSGYSLEYINVDFRA